MSKPSRNLERIQRSLVSRYRAEKAFRLCGIAAVTLGLLAVLVLFADIFLKGKSAFSATYIQLEINYDQEVLGIDDLSDEGALMLADWDRLHKTALRQEFPQVRKRSERRELYALVSNGAGYDLKERLLSEPELLDQTEKFWILADDDIDTYYKSLLKGRAYTARLSLAQLERVKQLIDQDRIELQFNANFLSRGDSREPEQVGIKGAMFGSFFTLVITLLLSFPIGIAAAIYLEEFAEKNRWTEFIEVNINNLAAVPSIIFGLLGLAIFINFFNVPRSIPFLGGLVLAVMTLPTIIITSRAAIKSVPPSIREAALGLGASPNQVVLHYVVPLAMPGMLTGSIIGMARALGETAPLLMIGMVAFIADVPGGFTDPATVLPVQIFLWADSPERAFIEKTSAAIMVLLAFLITMNLSAVWLRKKLERRW
jgi:phosphate transport system permease protein